MATLNVIRRWALRDQMSIREISRRTGLARNTIKKHLRSEENELKYPRWVSSSKLDPYAEKLATWLGIEATKSRKQRRTLRQIHTMLAHVLLKVVLEQPSHVRHFKLILLIKDEILRNTSIDTVQLLLFP